MQDEMTIDERRKYTKVMAGRYRKANRPERSRLLSEMEAATKQHRKHLILLLNAESLERKKRQTLRSRTYGADIERVILLVWESLDSICAQCLTPTLLSTAQHLDRFGEVSLTAQLEEQLQAIGVSTVQRLLRKHRASKGRLPRKGLERANQATKGVPMKRIPWDISESGHIEMDLVHHGGESASGEYGYTLQLIDVAIGWSERVMLLGRGKPAMAKAFTQVIERLPFPIQELHPDNGTEFFNQHLLHLWKEKVSGVQLSRSRPYQKKDNRNVEQKNDTLVRHYFGELRLETPEQIATGNALYEQIWVYYNLFEPVMDLVEKTVEGDKVYRKWDDAQTPYQRLLATNVLSPQQQARLQALYEQTNPLRVRQEIYRALAA